MQMAAPLHDLVPEGVGNGIELSDAQLAATNAGFQLLQATLRLDTARAQLQKALGRR